ncbi:MAG: ATP-binding cassette domain-containing protein [Acidimicrobiia bacterium]|nr:ATP-binding cassette domain-containing protein [Acidimicrobiia bacterium]
MHTWGRCDVLLELSNLTAGYQSGPDILQELSLGIEADRSYCIIGPNGAGKSTLLKVVAGILTPRMGTVTLDGEEVGGLRPDELLAKGICFVPQDPSLFPKMSVRQNLTMGAFLESDKRVVEDRIGEVFSMFPILDEKAKQLAGTLSGGQQQMLLLGRALMIKPRLMMIDEPSLGLAPQAADQVFETINHLGSLGITVLLVEQSVERGLAVSDWAFVLDLGQLRFEGPSDEILADPRIGELYMGKAPEIE